jgi:hypothetical protein
MSTGELIGLLATVVLFAGGVGVVATALVAARRGSAADARKRRLDAYAQWLAAHKTLARASTSFVAAFRVLAAEHRDAVYFSLRSDEAQRARAAWCDAMRELDRAEASLVVWSADPSIHGQLVLFQRPRPEALRAAIDGDQVDVDRLSHAFHGADELAVEFVIRATVRARDGQSATRRFFALVAAHVETIVHHWSRKP